MNRTPVTGFGDQGFATKLTTYMVGEVGVAPDRMLLMRQPCPLGHLSPIWTGLFTSNKDGKSANLKLADAAQPAAEHPTS